MKMKKAAFAAVLTGAALVFSACSPEPWEIEQKYFDPKDLSKVVIHKDLQEQLTITRVTSIKTETGLLAVAINARDKAPSAWNYVFHSYKMSKVKYRLDWIKSGKSPKVVKGDWQYLELKPGYKFGAIYESNDKAQTDFKFYIEPATEQEWSVYQAGKKVEKTVPAPKQAKAKDTGKAAPAKKVKNAEKATPVKKAAPAKKVKNTEKAAPVKKATPAKKVKNAEKAAPAKKTEKAAPETAGKK